MEAVNKAYDQLFAVLETKETDKGTMLFSRSQSTHVQLIELSGDEIKGSTPAETRKNANDYISSLIDDLIKETGSDILHNNSTNTDIRLTKKGVVHGFQHRGVQNVKAIAAIRQLIENAVKIATNSHDPANDNFKNVITLVAPLKLGDQYYAVKLTVKESWDGKFKLYDHQALDMEMPDGISESTSDQSDSIHRPTSGTEISVEQMLSAFKGDNEKYLSSKSTTPTTNPHTPNTLRAAITKALDGVFGSGWMARLEATGKFKIIGRDEGVQIAGNEALDAKGFYDPKTDTTFLIAENISKNKDLISLLLHEISTHALQLGKSNEAFQALLKRFEAMQKFNPKVKEAFARVPDDTKPEHRVEEALAYFLENNPDSTFKQRIIEAFRQLVRAIGNTLIGKDKFLFSNWANKLTETEILSMATSALRKTPDSLQFDNVGRESEAVKFVKIPQSDIKLGQKANDPVKVGGDPDLWVIPEEVDVRTKGRFKSKPVRLLMGKHFGENHGFRLTHIEAGHAKEIAETGMTTEQWVVSVIKSATKIFDNGSGRLVVYSAKAPKGVAFIELRNDGDFYSVVSAYDTEPKGKIVWSGRRHLISSEGSNVSGTQGTVATTTGLPINPAVRTDAIAGKSSTQSRETLTDQTTDENIAQQENSSSDIKFSRSMSDLTDQAQQFWSNHTDTSKTFNLWHKTIGTQTHKATVDKHYKAVVDKSMDFENDVAAFANEAADMAPSWLPKLDEISHVAKEVFLRKGWTVKDTQAAVNRIKSIVLRSVRRASSTNELHNKFTEQCIIK